MRLLVWITVCGLAFAATALGDVNRLDFTENELTSDQQPSRKNDVAITREIRQDIVANKDLSFYAHNVKIITGHGLVILRGPVRTREEETKVVKVAQSVAGPSHVVDNLHVSQVKTIDTNKRRFL
jgi:hyperosmotically inducible protein